MTMTTHLRFNDMVGDVERTASIAIRMMMEDVHTMSTPITPKSAPPDGGSLRASVTKQMPYPLVGIMTWNVPYAQYQERGMRADGSYVVKHYTTPGTHAHFVEESVEKVVQKIPTYLRMGGLV